MQPQKSPRAPHMISFLRRYWPYAATFIITSLVAWHNFDPDFGWHLRSGEYFLNQGVPTTDIFTYTAPNFPWVNHEWLADILLYLIHSTGGYGSLVIFYSLLWTAAIYLVARGRKANFILFFATIGLIPYVGVRAMTWTMFFAGLLWLIINSKKISKWWLVPLFLLWSNMHGGFLIGLVYIGWVWLTEQRTRKFAIIGILSALATTVNVYGATGIYGEIFATIFDTTLKSNIQEWTPLGSSLTAVFYVAIWAVMLIATSGKDWKKYIRFSTILFFAAISSNRHLPLFILFSLPQTLDFYSKLPPLKIRREDRNMAIGLGVALLIAVMFVFWSTRDSFIGDRDAKYIPNIARHLEQGGCSDGRVFNYYDVGGYLIWKAPNTKVYIDGRMPSWRENGVHYMSDYIQIITDAGFRKKQFDKYDIRCVVWPKKSKGFIEGLRKDGWTVSSVDDRYYLLLIKK